ncbi:MAG: hypothetical protein WDM91_21635 [Rhizomicrobium sp.]
MSRVPVGGSIAHAYEFLFGRFFQIIGTAWLPALIYGAAYYVMLQNRHAWMPVHGADAGAIAGAVGTALAGALFFLLIRSVIGISLTQEALGVRKDLTLAHFVVGPRELRLFFGYIRFELLFIVLYLGILGVCFGVLFAAKAFGAKLAPNLALHGVPIATVAAIAFSVVLLIWFALSMLRLAFLLAPVASAEHRTRLSRAWEITRGSTLRILFVLIGTFLPVAIAAGVAGYYLLGPADVAALLQALHKAKAADHPQLIQQFLSGHAVLLAGFTTVLAIINGALLAGASAAAYRTVTGHEDPEPEDDSALVAPLLAPVAAEEEPLPTVPDHNHGHDSHDHHEDHGHHKDHGHHEEDHGGHGHDDHGHGEHGHHGHDDHGAKDGHAHDEDDDEDDTGDDQDGHGHGAQETHGHSGHGDHGSSDHGDHGHGSHDDHGHGGHDDHGHHGGGHDDHSGHGHHHASAA